ncbi:hypothetical protein GUJ93_ZPchr0009g1030 [Zizania palustris]|uniref:Uncharacterized protein n=1 Tax=Zizania palustris TaxID=103762 RepID=A0A8J5VNG7_ZIZPA|nr:hypothetical protein GUJ93_ZPchr0009g1030 [Zizania palustris]
MAMGRPPAENDGDGASGAATGSDGAATGHAGTLVAGARRRGGAAGTDSDGAATGGERGSRWEGSRRKMNVDSNKIVGSILNDLEVMETMDANLTLEDLEDMEKQPESSDEEE